MAFGRRRGGGVLVLWPTIAHLQGRARVGGAQIGRLERKRLKMRHRVGFLVEEWADGDAMRGFTRSPDLLKCRRNESALNADARDLSSSQ